MVTMPFSLKTQSHFSKTMEVFGNPSKRPRLDFSNNHDENFGNDDLWGDDGEDFTAEQIDELEVQATQKLGGNTSVTFRQPCSTSNGSGQSSLLKAEEERKQKQYELEGKIKILTDNIETMSRELKEGKQNRDKIVNQKVEEFQEKEKDLQIKIKKLESMLQFKDQEMKAVHDKVRALEIQVKEKKEIILKRKKESPEKKTKISPEPSKVQFSNDFLKKFNFDAELPHRTADEHNKTMTSFRRYKLQVNTPLGKTQGCDIVSSILCNRLVIPPAQNPFFSTLLPNQCPDTFGKNSAQLSAVSIARLNSDKKAEELLDYFDCTLKNYLSHLKGFSAKNVTAGPSTTSPLSLRRKESNQDRSTVISGLKDLEFFLSCHQFASLIQNWEHSKSYSDKKVEPKEQISNASLATCYKITDLNERMHSLLQSLICLLNPKIYPSGYPKIEEIELSLAVLLSWSSTALQNLMQFASEIPFVTLINTYHSIATLQIVIKLLANMCICKGIISIITHQNDACVLCSIASLTLQISASPLEFLNVMLVVIDFLSTLFTVCNFSELKFESSSCSTVILEGIVTSLWKFYQIPRGDDNKIALVLRKGFTLLHFLSRYFPNFKAKRAAFEDYYISLVCGMLALSKENPLFRDFYDLVHDLWDFQDDTSEFDLDEPSEDSLQNTDLLSQNTS